MIYKTRLYIYEFSTVNKFNETNLCSRLFPLYCALKKWWEKFYRQSQAYLVDHKALSLLYGRCNLLHTLHTSALANISNPAILLHYTGLVTLTVITKQVVISCNNLNQLCTWPWHTQVDFIPYLITSSGKSEFLIFMTKFWNRRFSYLLWLRITFLLTFKLMYILPHR